MPEGWFKSARAAKTRKYDPQGEPMQTTFSVHSHSAPAPRPFGMSPAGCLPYENLHVFPMNSGNHHPYQEEPEPEVYAPSHLQNYPHGPPYRSVSPSPSQSSFSSSDYSSPSIHHYNPYPHQQQSSPIKLVPLNVLESVSAAPRDPMDEQLLQKFACLAPLRPSLNDFRHASSSSFP